MKNLKRSEFPPEIKLNNSFTSTHKQLEEMTDENDKQFK